MLTKIWTGTLLFFAWLSFCTWLVLVCREKNVHPLRDFAMFFKKQTKAGRIIFGTFFIAMWIFASVKPDGDYGIMELWNQPSINAELPTSSTTMNNSAIPQYPMIPQSNADSSASTQMGNSSIAQLHNSIIPQYPITSTNTLRTITADDFARGFVQTRIGTDEEFDFSPLANATIVSDWRAFGAATD